MNQSPETPRTRRVADRIVQVLAQVFERHTEDPRLRQITVTGARVTRDLGAARVWVTGGFAAADEPKILAALQHATPRFRSLLAPELRLRVVPTLTFAIDHAAARGARIEELLREIHEEQIRPAGGGGDDTAGTAGEPPPERPEPTSQED